ncbi:MAG: hypothetical protein EBW15_11135, partial [Actinobacteria bacterium]|nr:hypothetical protein [Actinomycetota bacterium]
VVVEALGFRRCHRAGGADVAGGGQHASTGKRATRAVRSDRIRDSTIATAAGCRKRERALVDRRGSRDGESGLCGTSDGEVHRRSEGDLVVRVVGVSKTALRDEVVARIFARHSRERARQRSHRTRDLR